MSGVKSSLMISAVNSNQSSKPNDVSMPVTFTPSELGLVGVSPGKLPKSIKVSATKIEEKVFRHFGITAEQAKARLNTETNPFAVLRTGENDEGGLAYFNPQTGKYVVSLRVENKLYRALANKAVEIKKEIRAEKESKTENFSTPNENINGRSGINQTDLQRAKLDKLLRDAEILPSSFGLPSDLKDLNHVVVTLPQGVAPNADNALTAYIEKRYGNSNLFGQDKIDILNSAKQNGVKVENLQISPNNSRVVEFDLSIESLLKLQKSYLDVQYKVNKNEAIADKIKHEMALNQFLLGAMQGAWDDVKGTYNTITSPLQTIQQIREAIVILSQLSPEDLKAITAELGNKALNATPGEAAYGAGYVVGTAIIELLAAKGAGAALSALGKTKAGAEFLARIGKLADKTSELASLGKAKIAETFSDEAASLASLRARQKFASLMFYNGAAGADILADLSIVAGNKIKNGAVKFTDFSKQMIAEVGEKVKPHLEKLYREQLIELNLKDKTDEIGIAKSKLSKLSDVELKANLDPTIRPGETIAQAKERISQAFEERKLRGYIARAESLGDNPAKVNIGTNDAKYRISYNAHTDIRHSPNIILERNSAPAGTRTIEGRIYGDPPWSKAENFSYKWIDESTMNRTINEYLEKNWDSIRWELATKPNVELTFDAGKAIGEGFFNAGQGGIGHRQAVYSKTSYVKVVIKLDQTEPMIPVVVTAHPLGKGEIR